MSDDYYYERLLHLSQALASCCTLYGLKLFYHSISLLSVLFALTHKVSLHKYGGYRNKGGCWTDLVRKNETLFFSAITRNLLIKSLLSNCLEKAHYLPLD